MKVVHINATAGVGSTGRLVDHISEGLRAAGHKSSLAYSTGQGALGDRRIGSRARVVAHALESRVTGLQGYGSRGDTVLLAGWLNEIDPDIVHLHNLHANYVSLPLLFETLRLRKQRVVVTMHDCWFLTGKCTSFDQIGCVRWKHSCGSCPQLAEDIPSWFFDRTERMRSDKVRWFEEVGPTAVVGVSNWGTRQIEESHLRGKPIIRRIYNWVDERQFFPDVGGAQKFRLRHDIDADAKVILGVADKWTDSKGLEQLVRLAAILPSNARLVIIGGLVSPADLPPSVLHIPRTTSVDELRFAYSAADVYVSTSVQETFGLTVVEAMACGTPSVVMNATASPELISEISGLIVQPGDTNGLLVAVNKLFDFASGRSAISENADARFGRERGVQEYIEVYKELLKDGCRA